MKNFFISAIALTISNLVSGQVLFSNSLGNLTLQTYSNSASTTQYTTVPSLFSIINDGHNNNTGGISNPNAPFHVAALKTAGWAVVYNASENDTFFVSTSWLDSTLASSRWIITPSVSNITANTVLTWLAKSPDAANADGYEVYGTNKTGTLVPSDFTIGDRLFNIADGNTAGGGEKNTWTRRAVNIGAFAGQTLRFAFRNNSSNMYQLWIDDIEVKTVALNLDGALSNLRTEKYFLTNTSQTVAITFSNTGAAAINSVTLNYQYGTSAPVSEIFTFTAGLNYGQSAKVTFAMPYSFSSPGLYPFKIWSASPNNSADQNTTNDTLNMNVTVQSSTPQKNVLVEQFVSAKDPETVDAQEKLLALQSSSVVVINIHDNDSLKETNSAGILAYKKSFSTAVIDRVYQDSLESSTVTRPYYANRITKRLLAVTPASVSIINKNFNSINKQLTFTVKVDFTGEVKGDYRINAYLTENHVYGNPADTLINGYNQLSNYYFVPWSPYYQTGYYSAFENAYVLKAAKYKHQRVLIHSFNGSFGNPGIIPQTGGTQNQSYQSTFSITIPTATNGISKYNADNIYIVGTVAEYSADPAKRTVLNVVQDKLTPNSEVVTVKDIYANSGIQFFPNPTNGILNLISLSAGSTYDVKVYDLLGKCVFQKIVMNVYTTEKLDLSGLGDGAYILNITSGNSIYREKILKQ